jgi:hypothetical protein
MTATQKINKLIRNWMIWYFFMAGSTCLTLTNLAIILSNRLLYSIVGPALLATVGIGGSAIAVAMVPTAISALVTYVALVFVRKGSESWRSLFNIGCIIVFAISFLPCLLLFGAGVISLTSAPGFSLIVFINISAWSSLLHRSRRTLIDPDVVAFCAGQRSPMPAAGT